VGGFEVFDHTSDVGVLARGRSLEETLEALCLGAFSIITDTSSVRAEKEWLVTASGRDLGEATIRMLNEALYLHETERVLFSSFSVRPSLGDGVVLELKCRGEPYDPGRHTLLKQLKAATYHDLSVENHEARVIFDV
jgi:SHS2 domain-containing protein